MNGPQQILARAEREAPDDLAAALDQLARQSSRQLGYEARPWLAAALAGTASRQARLELAIIGRALTLKETSAQAAPY